MIFIPSGKPAHHKILVKNFGRKVLPVLDRRLSFVPDMDKTKLYPLKKRPC